MTISLFVLTLHHSQSSYILYSKSRECKSLNKNDNKGDRKNEKEFHTH